MRADWQNVYLSGGVGIGGVLELLQAGPVIIEDDRFIGAWPEVVEGVVVEQGVVLFTGVFIGHDQDRELRHRGNSHGPRTRLFGCCTRHPSRQAVC